MKRKMPWSEPVDLISSDDSSSSDAEMEANNGANLNLDLNHMAVDVMIDLPIKEMKPELIKETTPESVKETTPEPIKEMTPEGMLLRSAEMYQEAMRLIPIPMQRGSVIPFNSWVELGKSLKQLYGQPLHYLTNILLKQWDQLRVGSVDEYTPLDMMIHPCKAEANVWLVEEVHRRTTSHHHVAKLWSSDPMHNVSVDSTSPQS